VSKLIKERKKTQTLYKVRDSDGQWITLSMKQAGPLVKKSFTGGKVYPSISSFQSKLKSFLRFGLQTRTQIRYGEKLVSPMEFSEIVLSWKIVPFSQGHNIDMTFIADTFAK